MPLSIHTETCCVFPAVGKWHIFLKLLRLLGRVLRKFALIIPLKGQLLLHSPLEVVQMSVPNHSGGYLLPTYGVDSQALAPLLRIPGLS